MKVAFLFNEYSLHNHILEQTIRARPQDEFVIVKIPLVVKGKSRLDSGRKILPKLSLRFILEKFYEFLLLTYITFFPKVLPFGETFRRIRWIAKRYGVKYFRTDSITSETTLTFLKAEKPDLIVTLMHQIVKGELLTLAPKGIINIHPGLLPEFKGIQPYFWELSEGFGKAGATFHYIEDEGVDTGGIVAQASFRVPPHASVSLTYYLTARSAAEALPQLLERLENGALVSREQDPEAGSYFRFPDNEAFQRLWSRGHTLVRAKDIFSIIFGAYDGFHPDSIDWSDDDPQS